MELNERLKAVRTALNLSQRAFCKGIYTSQSFYAKMEQGKMLINDRIIELVCSKYKVNKTYLKGNKGEMFSETPPDVRQERLNQIFEELNGLFQEYLLIQAKELLRVQKQQGEVVEPAPKGKKTTPKTP